MKQHHIRSVLRRRGMSLVESVLAIVVTGTMMVAAVETVGAVTKTQTSAADRGRAKMYAQALMTEILAQAYAEPDVEPRFGIEGDESDQVRTLWDDVDDYDGWWSSPMRLADGTEIPTAKGWAREVEVEWVWPIDPNTSVEFGTGMKRITVVVTREERVLASISALRSEAGLSTVAGRRPTAADLSTAEQADDKATAADLVDFILNGEGKVNGAEVSAQATQLGGR